MKSSKKALAFALAAAMVVTAFPVTNAEAASTAKLSTTKVTVAAGTAKKQTKSIKVTTPSTWKSVKVKVSSSDKKIATVKASGKTVKVTAVKKGSAKVTVKVTAKKAGKAVSKTLTAKAKVVGAGLRITSEAAEVNTGATLALTVKKVPSTAKLTYASKDETIATVSPDGVVTGVKAGKTTITVTSDYGKTVEKEITVVDVVAQLTAVKQTASNAFTATFSAATPQYTKDDIKVDAADGSAELAVKSVEYSADKMSAVVTLFGNLKDATDYNVTCKDSKASFKASVGEVASVAIKTTSAQTNVKTPIEFSLLDATGIDVTPAKDIDSHCVVTVTGNYSTADLTKASEANITMTNIGDEAEVEVTYDSGVKGADNVSGKATIKCVKAEAVSGTTMFKATTNLNANSQCAKFYLETPDTNVKVAENATSDPVYFCATDKNTGDVISYDKYEAESSNDDVATVAVSKDSGKFATLTVTGNTVGNAQINITATKNGEASYYTIPVIVSKVGVAVKMTVDADYRTMSDSSDTDYKNNITAKFFDADGNEVKTHVSYTCELANAAADGSEDNMVSGHVFKTNGQTTKAKTYNITVKGQDDRSDKSFTNVIGVTVKKLPDKAWTTTGAAMTYQLEIKGNAGDKNLDENSNNHQAKVRVYATCNSLFAGYLDSTGAIAGGDIHADATTAVNAVKIAAKYGNEYYKASDLITANKDTKANATSSLPSGRLATYETVKANVSGKIVVKANDNTTLAKIGTWTVEATLTYTQNSKDAVKTNTFTVKNSAKIPTVKVTTRNVDSLTFTDVQKVLKTSVDMNNDTSDYVSVVALEQVINNVSNVISTGSLTAINSDANKALVKNVVVEDGAWQFYVPINTTFTVK